MPYRQEAGFLAIEELLFQLPLLLARGIHTSSPECLTYVPKRIEQELSQTELIVR